MAQLLPRGEDHQLVRTVAADAVVEAPGTTAVRLRFPLGLSINGTVVDERTGHPLAGAKVEAEDEVVDPPQDPETDVSYPEAGGQATTDPEGRFVIRHLRANPHAIHAWLPGYTSGHDVLRTRPDEGPVVLKLRPDPRLMGRVLSENGVPIPRFTVDGHAVQTSDGRVAIPTDRTGPETIRVDAEEFASTLLEVELDGASDLDLGDIRLARGRTVKVTVASEASGRPVDAATVKAGVARARHPTSLEETLAEGRTGPDGVVTLRNLPGAPLLVVVEAVGTAPAREQLAGDTGELTVRLGDGGRIEGSVRNASGQPVRNVPVSAGSWSIHRETLTDEAGHFVLDTLPPDDYVVDLHEQVAEGNAGFSHQRVKLAPGATARVNFNESTGATLVVLSRHGCFALLARGEPLAAGGDVPEALRAALYPDFRRDGAHLFRGLAPGVYTVLCPTSLFAIEDRRLSFVRVEVGGADLEVTAPEATILIP